MAGAGEVMTLACVEQGVGGFRGQTMTFGGIVEATDSLVTVALFTFYKVFFLFFGFESGVS